MESDVRAIQKNNGGVFADSDENGPVLRYGDVKSECEALRQQAGLLEAGHRALLRVTGEDRTTFLQGMITNDLKAVAPGDGLYAALLTIQGRVVTDLNGYVLEDSIWLDLPRQGIEAAQESLDRYIIADDVELDPSQEVAPLAIVAGPQAAKVLLEILGEDFSALPAFAHRPVSFGTHSLRVAATSYTGVNGYTLFGPRETAATLWERALAAGAVPVGREALEVTRIEAGIPWLGVDMSETNLIGEVGIESAISFRKGCYLGQEVVERVAARGQVQRKRVGLRSQGSEVPPHGAKLQHDGKDVGTLTSAVRSPLQEQIIGMGYVRREAWNDGTTLSVHWDGGETSMTVAPLS